MGRSTWRRGGMANAVNSVVAANRPIAAIAIPGSVSAGQNVTLNASAESTPISYKGSDGRQFVAITATGGGLIGAKLEGDEVVAFALPKK